MQTHLDCPCGKSKKSYSINDKQWGHCFSCNKNFPPKETVLSKPTAAPEVKMVKYLLPFVELGDSFTDWSDRRLSSETLKKYGVTLPKNSDVISRSPLYDGTEHIANKIRKSDKGFAFEYKDQNRKKVDLFGQQAFPAGGKMLTITEGYEDAMSVYEMNGRRYPAVSIHSASTAFRDCQNAFEYINSFEKIVLVFDNDEPGKRAAEEVCKLPFPLGKVHVTFLSKYKDASDYLVNRETEAFTREWWAAAPHRPNGLKFGKELLPDILNRRKGYRIPFPWEGMNEKTFGLSLSEMLLVMADTGVGKTSVMKEIEHALLVNEELREKGYGIGLLHFEEPNGDTALGLLSVHDSVPYHLPDVDVSEERIRESYSELLDTDRLVIWDHFGSNSVEEVVNKVRHMHALGCRYIVIDHLSIIVSDQSGDERKQLDEISTKLKMLTVELDIALICVIHTNRKGEVRGSAGPEKVANIIMRLERDVKEKDEWRRNVTTISIEKNRFSGRTGPCCHLFYNPLTGRLSELSKDEVVKFEEGIPVDNPNVW